jgi:hypothetical protein
MYAHIHIVELLLDKNANINAAGRGGSALQAAVSVDTWTSEDS